MKPWKVKIVVTIGVETARGWKGWKEAPPRDSPQGEFRTSLLLGHRVTRSMANMLASELKREVLRRGFRALKGYNELRT